MFEYASTRRGMLPINHAELRGSPLCRTDAEALFALSQAYIHMSVFDKYKRMSL